MRIGILIYGLDRPLTGIGRYTLELVKALATHSPRPDITLLCAGGLGPLQNATPFRAVRLPFCRLLPNLMTGGQLVLAATVRRLKLDLIHDPTGVTPFLFIPSGIKRIVTIHDVFAWSIPGHSSRLDTLIYRFWLPRLLPSVDKILTASQQSLRDIVRYLAPPTERIRVVPYGVGASFKPLPTKVGQIDRYKLSHILRPYLLYVGSLTKRKNVERALEAFAAIQHDYPTLRFVLAGPSAWQQTPLAGAIERLQLADRVQVTGHVSEEALRQLYRGAQAFVFPSLYEGFGLPPLEAMACGTPVITSNVSSLPEVVGPAALLIDPYDVAAIAAAMRRILNSPQLARQLAQRGVAQARQFTWQQTARQTIAIYKRG